MAKEYVLWGLPKGETDHLHAKILYTRGKDMADVERVKKLAAAEGWHTFSVQVIDLSKPFDARDAFGRTVLGDFKAEPTTHRGPAAGGTARYPGFHTADRVETTLPYAQMKLGHDVPSDPDEDPILGLSDYPVIVTLDMNGLDPKPDADVVWARNDLQDAFREISEEMKNVSDDSLLDVLLEYVESTATSEDAESFGAGSDAVEALFSLSGVTSSQILHALSNYVETLSGADLIAVLTALRDGLVRDDVLMAAIGQYRYTVDVPESRILCVRYIQPYFGVVLADPQDSEEEERLERIEAAGYVPLTEEDVFSGSDRMTVVEDVEIRSEPAGARVEFHGTTYHNLLSAAPGLVSTLPVPPEPYESPE